MPTSGNARTDIIRGHWQKQWEDRKAKGNFEQFWQKALHDGVIPETPFKPKVVKLKAGWEKAPKPGRRGSGGDGATRGED